jgi:hypothetical protein
LVIKNRGLFDPYAIFDMPADNEQVATRQKAMAGAEEIHSLVSLAGRVVERLIFDGDGLTLAKFAVDGISRGGNPEKGLGEVLVEQGYFGVAGIILGIISPTPVEDLAVRQQAGMNDDIGKIEQVCPSSNHFF